MIRYTTPTLSLKVTGADLSDEHITNVYVTLQQGDLILTKDGQDLDYDAEHNTVLVFLSEAETAAFAADNPVLVQVNWLYTNADGTTRRAATNIAKISVTRQLLTEELTQ